MYQYIDLWQTGTKGFANWCDSWQAVSMTDVTHPVIPTKYAGKWIAWDKQGKKILASGRTFANVRKTARAKTASEPQMMKVPRGRFVGAGR